MKLLLEKKNPEWLRKYICIKRNQSIEAASLYNKWYNNQRF